MKEIKLKKVADASQFKGKPVTYKDYNLVIKEDCIISLEGNFPIVYVSLKNQVPKELLETLNRIKFEKSVRRNGLKSNNQVVFGNVARDAFKNDYCHHAAIELNDEKASLVLKETSNIMSEMFRNLLSPYYKLSMGLLNLPNRAILPQYMMEGLPYTSGILNKDNALAYHYDGSNMNGIMSSMLVLKKGIAGGFLSFPQYGFALECSNESLVIFNGKKILHGVSPIEHDKEIKNSYRYSMVLYTLDKMTECDAMEDELSRLQNKFDNPKNKKQ